MQASTASDYSETATPAQWRKAWPVAVILVALWLIYAATPLAAMAMLFQSAKAGNTASVAKSVDLAKTRRSIARQLVVDHAGKRNLAAGEQQMAIGVGTASVSAWLEDVITVESIVGLVSGAPLVMSREGQTVAVPAPDIGQIDFAKAAEIWWLSGFKGPVNYTVYLPGKTGADDMSLELALVDWRWQIIGVNLSPLMREKLAQKVADIAGGKVLILPR